MATEQVTRAVHPVAEAVVDPLTPVDLASEAVPAGGEAPTVVEVTALTRRFGGRAVIDGADLRLRAGEFVAVLGRSGTGKSTLLRALAGLDRQVHGEIRVPRARSVVFQDARLVPWARVLDNVILGLGTDDARTRGLAALEEVGLAGHTRAWPKTLSGGEAQRVALARALVREPGLLLLDEPFGALDALTRIRMHALLRGLWQRHNPAVLLVTHDVEEAIQLADRVLVMADGRFVLNTPVAVPAPRDKADPALVALRRRLLASLGVTDTTSN
ncbi:ABC transporter ATP-binding protein [Frankia sp. CiP3]|uniref:ABC transporter ATP-binding protein n=1 Tax=Frankia sp. CiP3 TaxID=2880971 RepID=UPI001EF51FB0|nr:ABC transporter ATP-binding protein [Frankia sp. CiP3]